MEYKAEAKPKAYADGTPVYCAHDAIVDVAKLVPNPKNPNTHPDNQIQLLGRIIRQTGWRAPITVSTLSGFIVKGHGRLSAALLEGLKEVPVDYQNYSNAAEEYSDLVADNRIAELSEIDNKLLADIFAEIDTGEIPMELTGYTDDEVEGLITALSEAIHNELNEPDEVPDEPDADEVVTQPGDIWILGGRHRVMCADCTNKEALDKICGGGTIDMIFTDPPYNINYKGVRDKRTIKNDCMSDEEFQKFLSAALPDCDTMYVCSGWQQAPTFRKAIESTGRKIKSIIVWDKVNAAQHLDLYFKQYEIIFYTGKFGGEPTVRGDIWQVKRQANTVHPTMKPVDLIKMALDDHPEKETVFDGFGGSGSTLIACEMAEKKCFMMEIEPKYVDVIVKRWARATGNTSDIELIRDGKVVEREKYEKLLEE